MVSPLPAPTPIRVHTDPLCPWAWLTSRWLDQLAAARCVDLDWHLFSLTTVNRDAAEGETTAPLDDRDRGGRALVLARRQAGNPGLGRLYRELGEAHHERGSSLGDLAVIAGAAEAAGLDAAAIVAAVDSDDVVDEWLTDHRHAVAQGAFGVPTLSVDGGAYVYGPVLDGRLTDDEALGLWEHVRFVLTNPHVYEIKRERTIRPQVGRDREPAATTAG